jgi:hypothetical protein
MDVIILMRGESNYAPLLGFRQERYIQYDQVKFTINIQLEVTLQNFTYFTKIRQVQTLIAENSSKIQQVHIQTCPPKPSA